MAHAYAYMDGDGPPPIELGILPVISRFGVEAVYGRPLYTHEIKNLIAAEVIRDAYNGREQSGDMADWARKNSHKAALLNEAMKWQKM